MTSRGSHGVIGDLAMTVTAGSPAAQQNNGNVGAPTGTGVDFPWVGDHHQIGNSHFLASWQGFTPPHMHGLQVASPPGSWTSYMASQHGASASAPSSNGRSSDDSPAPPLPSVVGGGPASSGGGGNPGTSNNSSSGSGGGGGGAPPRAVFPRDKGIVCKLHYLAGTCDIHNCPFVHVENRAVPLPSAVCNFYLRQTCLRGDCQFFHGDPAALAALQATGATTYNPAVGLRLRDPTDPSDRGLARVPPAGPQPPSPARPVPPAYGDTAGTVLSAGAPMLPGGFTVTSAMPRQSALQAAATQGPQAYAHHFAASAPIGFTLVNVDASPNGDMVATYRPAHNMGAPVGT